MQFKTHIFKGPRIDAQARAETREEAEIILLTGHMKRFVESDIMTITGQDFEKRKTEYLSRLQNAEYRTIQG